MKVNGNSNAFLFEEWKAKHYFFGQTSFERNLKANCDIWPTFIRTFFRMCIKETDEFVEDKNFPAD